MVCHSTYTVRTPFLAIQPELLIISFGLACTAKIDIDTDLTVNFRRKLTVARAFSETTPLSTPSMKPSRHGPFALASKVKQCLSNCLSPWPGSNYAARLLPPAPSLIRRIREPHPERKRVSHPTLRVNFAEAATGLDSEGTSCEAAAATALGALCDGGE